MFVHWKQAIITIEIITQLQNNLLLLYWKGIEVNVWEMVVGPKKEWILTGRFLGHRWIILLVYKLIQVLKEIDIFVDTNLE